MESDHSPDEFDAHCDPNSNTPICERADIFEKSNEIKSLAYRDLQQRARALGLKGNMKKDELIQEIISKESRTDKDIFELKVPHGELQGENLVSLQGNHYNQLH